MITLHRHKAAPTRQIPLRVRLFPFLQWGRKIDASTLRADLLAGLTGAFIVLPQGVSFAMIAGLPAEYGLYTAIIPPIIAALFGSSMHLVSGPTTAISIVLFATLSPLVEPGSADYLRMALTLTFLAGAFQLAFGLARLGTLINFVSHSVIVGFAAGAACLIATGQLKHALGIPIPSGTSFLTSWAILFKTSGQTNLYELTVAVVTLVCAGTLKTWRPRWPGLLIALIIGSLVCLVINGKAHGVRLLGSLPGQLPPLSSPDFTLDTIRILAPGALAIALMGLMEALSIARSISVLSNQHINGNQEFIGQGLSNIAGSFFSGYAGSGSFTRSGINFVDISGAMMLTQEVRRRKKMDKSLYLCRLNHEVTHFLDHGGFLAEIHPDHIFSTEYDAIAKIFTHLDIDICRARTSRIFRECQSVPGPDDPPV